MNNPLEGGTHFFALQEGKGKIAPKIKSQSFGKDSMFAMVGFAKM